MRRSVSVVFLVFLIDWTINPVVGLNMTVYYESLCPDSVDFLVNQLRPNYEHFKDVVIEFVPYGKATHTKRDDGLYSFHCQHGEPECVGNRQHACVLSQNNGQDKDVAFITCVMGLRSPTWRSSIEYCARKSGISGSEVIKCSTGQDGDELLAKHGDKTDKLDPPISFVPTIVFDHAYNETLQNRALTDLRDVLCEIKGAGRDICFRKKSKSWEDMYEWM